MAQKGLGRGLSALFDDGAAADGPAGAGVQTLPVADLSPSPFQPRQHFDPEKIAELAVSIKTQGILQPILAEHLFVTIVLGGAVPELGIVPRFRADPAGLLETQRRLLAIQRV